MPISRPGAFGGCTPRPLPGSPSRHAGLDAAARRAAPVGMTRSRAAALAFGAPPAPAGAAGTIAPSALGRPWLGPGADAPAARAALRAFWACDALPAALTVDGV